MAKRTGAYRFSGRERTRTDIQRYEGALRLWAGYQNRAESPAKAELPGGRAARRKE